MGVFIAGFATGFVVCLLLAIGLFAAYSHIVKDTYKSSTSKTVYWFYMTGCPHCDRMKGEWQRLKKMKSGVKFVEVNANDPSKQELIKYYNVKGYPHLVKVSGGRSSVYSGQRTAGAMKQWVSSN